MGGVIFVGIFLTLQSPLLTRWLMCQLSKPVYSTSSFSIRQPLCPMVGRRPQHAVPKLPCQCLVLSSAMSCRSSICPGRLSTAWLVSLVVFSCHMVSICLHSTYPPLKCKLSAIRNLLINRQVASLFHSTWQALRRTVHAESSCLTFSRS